MSCEFRCVHCGVLFSVPKSRADGRLFCSYKCRFDEMAGDARKTLARKSILMPSGCIEWTGMRNGDGYGALQFRGKKTGAHRVAYTVAYGEIQDGMVVMHRCDNPACINPEHLSLGTHADNIADMDRKGRRKTMQGECNHRAKLTAEAAREIRRLANSGAPVRDLAERFGVSWMTVYRVKTGLLWRHAT